MTYPIKKLGGICDLYQPKTISKKELKEDGKYSVFGANGIIGKYNKYNHEEKEVLITCRGATCGTINISKEYSWINGNAMVSHIKDKSSLDFLYLYYVLKGLDFARIISGSAQPQITRAGLKEIQIPLPPLLTQKAIVAKLDEIFAQIDQSKSKIQANIDSVDELWKSSLNKVFEEGEKEYGVKNLGESIKFKNGFAFKSKDFNTSNIGLQVIRIGNVLNINKNPVFIESNSRFDDFKLKENDIVIGLTGTRRKKDYLFPNIIRYNDKFYLNQRVGMIRVGENINYKYLYYYLRTNVFRNDIFQFETGTVNQGNISGKDIMNHKIPLPPLPTQKAIVAKLDKLSTETKQLKSKYQFQLESLEGLRKSTLDIAFKGELI